MAICSGQVVEQNNTFEEHFEAGSERQKEQRLKGILKSFSTPKNSVFDFKNECSVAVAKTPGVSRCESISSRRMERIMGSNDSTQAEQRLTANQTEDDDEPYFMAFTSATPTSPCKTSKWTRCKDRERESSSSYVGGMRLNYSTDPPIQISRYNGGKCQSNCSGRPESHSLTRRLIFRLFQGASILLIIMGIITLVIPSIMIPEFEDMLMSNSTSEVSQDTSENMTSQLGDIRTALTKWATQNSDVSMSIDSAISPFPANSTEVHLLNIPNLTFSLNNFQLCSPNSNSSGIYFLILVHSAPAHFIERQAIRTSWGSVKSFRNWSIRLVFLLGQISAGMSSIQEGILGESDLYGDIVSGNFDDTYRNLTYKHLMGYKWVLNHCPMAKFVIKTDDDAFIDIFQVFDFAQRNYGLDPSDILLCNIYPEGTKPVRNSTAQNPEGFKWIVTKDEYPFDAYPKYCGGLGYLATVDVIRRLSGIGDVVKRFLWIDDVFVTGIIRELAGKEPFYLNLRYSYDEAEYQNWLNDRTPRHRLRKIPYMFVHLPRGRRFDEDMAQLWRKTVRAWS